MHLWRNNLNPQSTGPGGFDANVEDTQPDLSQPISAVHVQKSIITAQKGLTIESVRELAHSTVL